MRLAERVAIVTGAAGGIGGAIALACAREGADLCLVDARPAADVARAATDLGRRAIEVAVDVTRRSEIEAMVRRTLEAFGRIDILVNAAGIVSVGAAGHRKSSALSGTYASCQEETFRGSSGYCEVGHRPPWPRYAIFG